MPPPAARRPDPVGDLEADLVALAAADSDLERDAEAGERLRIERAAVTLADRLRATRGRVELTSRGGGRHAGRVVEVGADWVLLAAPTSQHVVRLACLTAVRGLGRAASAPASTLPPRSLGSLLRTWCRDRAEVGVSLADGEVLAGLASAAYADHLELSTGGGATVAVPWEALAVVSR